MSKEIISTDQAPGAIGPYSQAIRVGAFIYTSGQLPIAPDGHLETADIKTAAEYSLSNIKVILEAAGCGMENIVKTTVFLTNLNDFANMNEIYAAFFAKEPPARSCVQVAKLPKDATIEIEAVAYIG